MFTRSKNANRGVYQAAVQKLSKDPKSSAALQTAAELDAFLSEMKFNLSKVSDSLEECKIPTDIVDYEGRFHVFGIEFFQKLFQNSVNLLTTALHFQFLTSLFLKQCDEEGISHELFKKEVQMLQKEEESKCKKKTTTRE
jgi:hypothetical protein